MIYTVKKAQKDKRMFWSYSSWSFFENINVELVWGKIVHHENDTHDKSNTTILSGHPVTVYKGTRYKGNFFDTSKIFDDNEGHTSLPLINLGTSYHCLE